MRRLVVALALLGIGCAAEQASPDDEPQAPVLEQPRPADDAGAEVEPEPDAAAPDSAPELEPDAGVEPDAEPSSSWDPEIHSLDGAHCCVGNDCSCWSAFCGTVEGRAGCCTAECGCGVVSEDGTSCEAL